MVEWLQITLIAAAAGILVLVLILIFSRCCLNKPHKNLDGHDDPERRQNLQNGIARLHQVSPHHHQLVRDASKTPNNYYLFQRGLSTKPGFSWADHPSLVTDAVENGWSRFAFTNFVSSSSPSLKSARSLLGACADSGYEPNVEIGWEVSDGSSDYLQKIRLNPNSKKLGATVSVIRSALPLPGPNLGNSSFPQEAYFEVTVLSSDGDLSDRKWKSDGDKIKLIEEDFNAKNSPDSVITSQSQKRGAKIGELKNDAVSMSVGLTAGGPLVSKPPGTFPGSIGFSSSGSVYLDGTKHIFESNDAVWGRSDKVIGCGYNPSQKKVIFTVDSQLVHEIHCKTEEFTSPLYPTISANGETVVLVNLGQSPFKYGPANLQRSPNPCFVGLPGNSPVMWYEDSRELFSMGRIDSHWQLQRNTTKSNTNMVNSIKGGEYDVESEGDLFEIVLESNGRSPYGALNQ